MIETLVPTPACAEVSYPNLGDSPATRGADPEKRFSDRR
jgi:hypothetical protein